MYILGKLFMQICLKHYGVIAWSYNNGCIWQSTFGICVSSTQKDDAYEINQYFPQKYCENCSMNKS